jgi:hypothetical protein
VEWWYAPSPTSCSKSFNLLYETPHDLRPLITCSSHSLRKEVKTGTTGLGIADNQNAHSMTTAVQVVVEMFKLVDREQELCQEIIALAISLGYESVRFHASYPVVKGDESRCGVTLRIDSTLMST